MKRRVNPTDFIRPNILRLEPYHCARETVSEGILLDANENPYPRRRRGVLVNRYPDPHQKELRQVLAERLSLGSESVLAGSGSDEILDWLFKVFDVGSGVAVAEPTYGMYRVLADIYDVPVFEFPLGSTFDFDADAFLRQVPSDTRLLFLCSPNNPTGNVLSAVEIRRLLAGWEGMVVLDEAYVDFAETESMVGEVRNHPGLVVLRTFSKAFGRAGLRLGYTVAHPEVIAAFLKVKAPYNLSALILEEGLHAAQAVEETRRQVERIRRERRRMEQALQRIPGIGPVFPSQANFVLFRCPRATQVCRELREAGIVVRDRSGLRGLRDCIRVTVGTARENDLFLARLESLTGRNGHGST